MTSETTDIRAEIRLLRDEVNQMRDRHLVIDKRYSDSLASLKILTHQSAESAKRACNAAELADAVFPGTVGEDDGFEEGVAGKAVGAM